MSFPNLKRVPLALAAMAACMSAHAGYTSPDGKFILSGFGTIGAVTTDNDDVLFQVPGQGGGAGETPNLNVDSKVAVQGTYKLTNTISGTAQVLTKYGADGSYSPEFEWAFAKWQALPSLAVRAGRMGAPLFMVSDFRDVGYANLTVRPSLDVYGQVPFSAFNGLDLTWQKSAGSLTFTTQLWAGNAKKDYAVVGVDAAGKRSRNEATFEVNDQIGLNIVAESDAGITFRLGHNQGKMSISAGRFDDLRNGANLAATTLAGAPLPTYQAMAPQFAAVAGLVTVDEVDASFTGLGVSIDRDNWVGSLEFTKRKTDSYVADSTGWYALVGHRFGAFTPYVGYSKLKTDRTESSPLTPSAIAVVDGSIPGAGTQISAGLDSVLAPQSFDETTSTLGVRWDATTGVALKAQWDHVKPKGEAGLFTGARAYDGKAVNVLTLAVDFVF